jgi:hypothetical protein
MHISIFKMLLVIGGIIAATISSTAAAAPAMPAGPPKEEQPNAAKPYVVVEVIVHPLFQQGLRIEKIYESYEERLQLTQSVMDHVKYRLGNKLIASGLFNSKRPLDITFELLRFDLVSSLQFIDPIDKQRSFGVGENAYAHALARAKLRFEKDGKIFESHYKITEENRLAYSANNNTLKDMLAISLDRLIEIALSDQDLVEFLNS